MPEFNSGCVTLIRKVTWLSTHKINQSWKRTKRKRIRENDNDNAWKWNLNVHIIFRKVSRNTECQRVKRICITTWTRFTRLRWHGKVIKFNSRLQNILYAPFSLLPKQIHDVNTKYGPTTAAACWRPKNFLSDVRVKHHNLKSGATFLRLTALNENSPRNPTEWVDTTTKVVSEIEFEIDFRSYWIVDTERIEARNAITDGKIRIQSIFRTVRAPTQTALFTHVHLFISNSQFIRIVRKKMRPKKEYQGRKRKKKRWFRSPQFMETSARILALLHSQKLIRVMSYPIFTFSFFFSQLIPYAYVLSFVICVGAIACDRNSAFCNNKSKNGIHFKIVLMFVPFCVAINRRPAVLHHSFSTVIPNNA